MTDGTTVPTVRRKPVIIHRSLPAYQNSLLAVPPLLPRVLPPPPPPPLPTQPSLPFLLPPLRIQQASRSLIPVVTAFVFGVLVLGNAFALLSASFGTLLIRLFPWTTSLGTDLLFIIDLALGILILAAAGLMLLGFRLATNGVLIPVAVLGLFLGGGFLIGSMIGLFGSVLGLSEPRNRNL